MDTEDTVISPTYKILFDWFDGHRLESSAVSMSCQPQKLNAAMLMLSRMLIADC